MCSVTNVVSGGISEDMARGSGVVPLEGPFRLHRQLVKKKSRRRKQFKSTCKSPTPEHILPRLLFLRLLLRVSHCFSTNFSHHSFVQSRRNTKSIRAHRIGSMYVNFETLIGFGGGINRKLLKEKQNSTKKIKNWWRFCEGRKYFRIGIARNFSMNTTRTIQK